jgi:hypothetical protein
MMFGKNSLDISGWPRAKCNARKWGTMSSTPGLLAWGWVAVSSTPAIFDPLDQHLTTIL